jgi:tetratricopeptide (TPR) repeat protein
MNFAAASAATIGDLHFEEDFAELMAAAEESDRPLLIKYYTDWCRWCQVLADSTLPDPYVQKFLRNFELGKINAEIDTISAARYGVRSYPTTLLLKADGIEIDRIIGYHPPEDYVGAIVNSLAGIGTLDDLLQRLAGRSGDLELKFKVAEKYMYRGDYNRATAYFNEVIAADSVGERNLAATASYKLAYMAYKDQDYLAAATRYARVAEDFPTAPEAIDAKLMEPYCYQQAEEFERARAHYQKFLEDYPETEEREWIAEQLEKMK